MAPSSALRYVPAHTPRGTGALIVLTNKHHTITRPPLSQLHPSSPLHFLLRHRNLHLYLFLSLSYAHSQETARLRSLRRAVEEARGVLNPRLLLLIPVASPWTWTFVFLRSHERLRPALHRLAPAAAQLVADRHVLLLPRLAVLDDLTPGAEVVARLRHRVAQALRPLLTWMAEEGEVEAAGGGGGSGGGGGGGGGGGQPQAAAPGPEGRGGAGGGAPEKLPVLFVAADVDLLAQRFVTATEAPPPPPPPQPLSVSGERSPAPGAAPTGGAHALRASLDMSIEGWDEAVPAYCEAARAAGGLGGGGGAAAAAASWGAPQSEGLADLGGAEMQRLLLARDRLYDVIKVCGGRGRGAGGCRRE